MHYSMRISKLILKGGCMVIEYYDKFTKTSSVEVSLREAFDRIEKAHLNARKEMLKTDKQHVLYAIRFYSPDGEVERIHIHRNMALSDGELDEVIMSAPNAYFDVLHSGTCRKACESLLLREKQREIRPITLKEANEFVNKNHRHHKGTVGCKFSIGLYECNKLIGVAICGRPVSRHLDNGEICEINRLCTYGGSNACSQLYGACARIAQNMGYKKIITYILQSESGTSLRASNFTCEGKAGGTHWTGKRSRGQDIPSEMKTRWVKILA